MTPTPPSHSVEFTPRELGRVIGRPLGVALLLAVALHALAALGLLPDPVPADLDRTLLAAKARLARAPGDARVVLVGDSSCLMNVDAPAVGRRLAVPVLNLGTLSYLGLDSHADLLEAFAATHAGRPERVVLLLHPESLRRSEPVAEYTGFLRDQLRLDASPDSRHRPLRLPRSVPEGLAASVLRERVVEPFVPSLLSGDFGPAYGSTRQVARHLAASGGSLLDPTRFDPGTERASAEYRLSRGLEEASRAFRSRLPRTVRLAVGLTPVPVSLATPDHDATARALLRTWAGWLAADQVLADLPGVMPDNRFATLTHLNAAGVAEFSRILAEALGAGPEPAGTAGR